MGGTVAGASQQTTGNQYQNQNQNTASSSTTTPWAPGASAISGVLGQLGSINTQPTAAENTAYGQITNLGQAGNPYQAGTSNAINNLLAGGGALNQSGLVKNAYSQYGKELAPYLSSSYLDPRNTPGFGDALAATNSDITNQINQSFAGAGRDLSGLNTQTLARGLSQGEGGLIQNQYNQNVGNQLASAGNLYNAGNATGGILSGFQNQYNANQAAGAGLGAQDYQNQFTGPLAVLQAQAQQRNIPIQALAAEMGIALPAATAFGTTSGTGVGTSTGIGTNAGTTQQEVPLWQQIAGGLLGGGALLGGNQGLISAFKPSTPK